jgi:VanZ family protein
LKKLTILAAYMALILATSLVPGDEDGERLRFVIQLKPLIQNLLHIPMFALLAILCLQVLESFNVKGARMYLTVAGGAVAFGALNELVQLWVPGRFGSLLDIGLNTFGVFLGILIYVLARKSSPNPLRRLVCG